MIDYTPLWKTMNEKGISQYQLLKSGIDNKTLDSIKKGRNITLLTLEKICIVLKCTPNDVICFTEEDNSLSTQNK
ncbi:MAG: helix-turn-helix domain-containing protein [Parasporobacterium sp.]|nr:helix-turn-helix domain-containing protein [Parasporobacterium sp.]